MNRHSQRLLTLAQLLHDRDLLMFQSAQQKRRALEDERACLHQQLSKIHDTPEVAYNTRNYQRWAEHKIHQLSPLISEAQQAENMMRQTAGISLAREHSLKRILNTPPKEHSRTTPTDA